MDRLDFDSVGTCYLKLFWCESLLLLIVSFVVLFNL